MWGVSSCIVVPPRCDRPERHMAGHHVGCLVDRVVLVVPRCGMGCSRSASSVGAPVHCARRPLPAFLCALRRALRARSTRRRATGGIGAPPSNTNGRYPIGGQEDTPSSVSSPSIFARRRLYGAGRLPKARDSRCWRAQEVVGAGPPPGGRKRGVQGRWDRQGSVIGPLPSSKSSPAFPTPSHGEVFQQASSQFFPSQWKVGRRGVRSAAVSS
jgi:hypothetical protein